MAQQRPAANLIAACSVLMALASTWVQPLRLLLAEGHGYYTFALVGDEPYYAERIQRLIPGTTGTNPHNGVADPNAISNLFLDGLLRAMVTALGLEVLTAFWIWRFVFPVVLYALLFWLARVTARRRPAAEHAVYAALAYGIIHAAYEICVAYPKLQGWIMRIPSGAEYLLSVAVLIFFWRFLALRHTAAAFGLATAMAALATLRPYSAVAWGPACALGAMLAMATGRLKLKTALAAGALGFVLLTPMIGVEAWNRGIAAHQEMMQRYFGATPYAIHPRWPWLLGIGALIGSAAYFVKGRRRLAVVALGASVALLAVLAGVPPGVRVELLAFDRFGCLYLPALAFAVLLAIRKPVSSGRLPVTALGVAACALSGAVLARNAAYDFSTLKETPYNAILKEQQYLAGYQFVAQHTPEDAWVLLDDTIDWTMVPPGDRKFEHVWYQKHWRDDMFSIVARRKRYSHLRLYMCPMSNVELYALTHFQRLTFGLRFEDEAKADRMYGQLLNAFKPGYIFWKREAPVPRGRGARLKDACEVLYTDRACEVWKIRYPEALSVFEDSANAAR